MAEGIFVDASFWIAFFYPLDNHHEQARSIWRNVVAEKLPTATTNWTLYETLTWLNCRLQRHDLAIRAMNLVSRSSEVVPVEAAHLENRSLEIFRSHTDKRWSVVDCANFACIEIRQWQFAVAYDLNFDQAGNEFGFRLLKP